MKKKLSEFFVAYIIASYVFFPLFIIRYVNFEEMTIWGDVGLRYEDIMYIIASPFLALKFGFDFIFYAPLEQSYLKTVFYWSALIIVTTISCLIVRKIIKDPNNSNSRD